jgi:hypothetical protein
MPLNSPLGSQELQPDHKELSPEEQEILNKIAQKVVKMQMTVPAILFLESVKPLNWIGSQAMVFFEPFVSALFGDKTYGFFSVKDYNLFRQMMERRENTERMLQKIEELDAIQMEKEHEDKLKRKAEKIATGGKIRKFWRKIFGHEDASKKIPPVNKN